MFIAEGKFSVHVTQNVTFMEKERVNGLIKFNWMFEFRQTSI